jgi:hypothetical protein
MLWAGFPSHPERICRLQTQHKPTTGYHLCNLYCACEVQITVAQPYTRFGKELVRVESCVCSPIWLVINDLTTGSKLEVI